MAFLKNTNHIRPAREEDASRIAEILVFNNRQNFFPIFKDEEYSFSMLQVVPCALEYAKLIKENALIFVYDDGIIRGFIYLDGKEVKKLYTDTFFQSSGVGAALIEYAVARHNARFLWALEKNTRGIAFYAKHGFLPNGEKEFEEGTTEYLIKLIRK